MMLSEIPPVKDVPPPTLTMEEEERIKADLVKKHEMKGFKEAGDLSMKVLFVYITLGVGISVKVSDILYSLLLVCNLVMFPNSLHKRVGEPD